MSDGYASDHDYFASYADPGVHRLMIQDHARTDAYRLAIESMARGKRVLDVGTGTGILSMFAARAGAAHVDAVDSSAIIELARDVAEDNGFGDKITFHRGRAEDLDLPGDYDLIVSEWMGFFGLAELMFESVIGARNRWMREGGHMLPRHLRLAVAPIDDSHVHMDLGIGLWERPVYGLDYSRLVEAEVQSFLTAACDLKAASLIGPPQIVLDLDLDTATSDDFFFTSAVTMPIERDGTIHGFGGWFEVDLAPKIELSCSPMKVPTHWRQSFFPVRPFPVERGDTIRFAMNAQRAEMGDQRLPLYFIDGEVIREGDVVHRFFYRHHGSFE
ncbi:ribosomal protein L11 methyltransferase [Planctomycetes bacterium Poly30]|uniref:Ribosomal protein L11 methyltransferase n=1 Tax=Saltatorellus ferox TaxID=2528018 RepID=A0A518ESW0_9BACT|nr:ribosomal protein L11 methyltransferase [Planctomycetes bacterium Poly30]